jgi:glycine cleavage system T protein (aminomethyltransferase)
MTGRTPLHTEHERLGATFTDFAGWQMPVRYSGDLAEHHAVRRSAGLFDLSHMGEIAVAGPDAGRALDHALASRLSAIRVGRAKYTLLCEPGGGVLDDLVVYRLGEHEYLVVANAANASQDLEALVERSSTFDVEVTDRSSDTALIAVQGPRSEDILISVAPDDAAAIAELKYYAARGARVAGIEVLLARTGYTGEDGFELYVPARSAVALWRALVEAGEPHGLTPAGLACRDTLRLEAGMALYGQELDVTTDPHTAGLGRVLALDKSFVGRDALEKLSRLPPWRTLVGLAGSGRRAARNGCSVHAANGRTVGRVTSGALSPTLGHPVALAYVDAELTEPGTELTVDIRGHQQTYTVVPLPFYRR